MALLTASVLLWTLPLLAQATPRRAFTVDDDLNAATLLDVLPSPDGQLVAAVIERGQSEPATHLAVNTTIHERGDIWIVRDRGKERQNITQGALDRSGSWSAAWSPTGSRLAFVSTKGGDNVRLYVWTRETSTLKRVSARGIDITADFWTASGAVLPFQWIDDTTLVFETFREGRAPAEWTQSTASMKIAARAWAQWEEGQQATSSAIETLSMTGPADSVELTRANIVSGTTSLIATLPLRFGPTHHPLQISPARTAIAFAIDGNLRPPDPERPVSFNSSEPPRHMGACKLTPAADIRWFGIELTAEVWWQRSQLPFRWSPDNLSIAALGRLPGGADTSTDRVFLLTLNDNASIRISPESLSVSDLDWTRAGLLVYAHAHASSEARPPRDDWWRIVARAPWQTRKVTGQLTTVPRHLIRGSAGRRALFIADEGLWSLDTQSGDVSRVFADSTQGLIDILWPSVFDRSRSDVSDLLIERIVDGHREFGVASIIQKGERVTTVREPEASGFLAYAPAQRLAVFAHERLRHIVVVTRDAEKADPLDTLIDLNAYLEGVQGTVRRSIGYRGANGDSLSADIMLPFGYQPGRRYPVVVVVYAGTVQQPDSDNEQLSLLSAHGYAVLFPSIPLPKVHPEDTYLDITGSVLPAIDRLIALGIADPDRLGVMGESFGGFTTYALITQTHQFKAAVALAGPADVLSLYGTFWAGARYTPTPRVDTWSLQMAETGQWQLGGTPMTNLEHYTRNSPLLYMDRVDTPLLIIQGDMDPVAIQQGEEVFTALYRMRKNARFVRYWGEGHGMVSPPNIRDKWREIFSWFDEHFGLARQ